MQYNCSCCWDGMAGDVLSVVIYYTVAKSKANFTKRDNNVYCIVTHRLLLLWSVILISIWSNKLRQTLSLNKSPKPINLIDVDWTTSPLTPLDKGVLWRTQSLNPSQT